MILHVGSLRFGLLFELGEEQVTETPAQPAGTTAADNDEAVEAAYC